MLAGMCLAETIIFNVSFIVINAGGAELRRGMPGGTDAQLDLDA